MKCAGWICVGWIGLQLTTGALAQDDAASQAAIGKWIATQRLIYQERKDWQQQKELLESRVELIRKEIFDLSAKLNETRVTAAEVESKKASQAQAMRSLEDDSAELTRVLDEVEPTVRALHGFLPPTVQEKVAPLFQRLPEDSHATRASVGERFQTVLGILNEINKANGEITVSTEVRTLSDGKPSEVKTLYLGLGQAYYLSVKGEAGIGHPTPNGWVWTPADDLAPKILQAVEILEGTAQPQFISLPVKIS